MVMMEMEPEPEPEPEPEEMSVQIAELQAFLTGSTASDLAESTAELFAAQLTRALVERSVDCQFVIGDKIVSIKRYEVELISIEDGSIKLNIATIGVVLIGLYQGIAAYPDFKAAIPQITEYLNYAISRAAEHFDMNSPNPNIKFEYSNVAIRKEDELEKEIANLSVNKDDFLEGPLNLA